MAANAQRGEDHLCLSGLDYLINSDAHLRSQPRVAGRNSTAASMEAEGRIGWLPTCARRSHGGFAHPAEQSIP